MKTGPQRSDGVSAGEAKSRSFPIILSAPSGGGKTTIARRLLKERDDLGYSVSCTTRQARPTEKEDIDYHFLTPDEFQKHIDHGDFAEWAEVHGNRYGTLKSAISKVLKSGRHVILGIDVQGARRLRDVYKDAVTVFVLPPSAEVLLQRLKKRKTESPQQLAARLDSALQELRAVEEYEYVVVNDDLDHAVRQVGSIIDAEVVSRERVSGLRQQVEELAAQLEAEIGHHSLGKNRS